MLARLMSSLLPHSKGFLQSQLEKKKGREKCFQMINGRLHKDSMETYKRSRINSAPGAIIRNRFFIHIKVRLHLRISRSQRARARARAGVRVRTKSALLPLCRPASMCQRLILILKGAHREPWEKGLARRIILPSLLSAGVH